jgi:hypothetical protein
MPKRKQPLPQIWRESEAKGQQHVSQLIYEELKEYAKDNQFYPLQHVLFRYMAEPVWNDTTLDCNPARYPDLTLGKFNFWFRRLIEEGFIVLDDFQSRAVRCAELEIVEKEPEQVIRIHLPPPDF